MESGNVYKAGKQNETARLASVSAWF